jgi:hypothetical protein
MRNLIRRSIVRSAFTQARWPTQACLLLVALVACSSAKNKDTSGCGAGCDSGPNSTSGTENSHNVTGSGGASSTNTGKHDASTSAQHDAATADPSSGGQPADGSGGMSGTGGRTGSSGSGGSAACPKTEPKAGASCDTTSGIACTYGSDPACRRIWMCQGSAWAQLNASAGDNCSSSGTTCPSAMPTPKSLCPDSANATCYYDPGIACFCQPGPASCNSNGLPPGPNAMMTHAWSCNPPAPCPLRLPMAGATCSTDGQSCEYPRDFCGADAPVWRVATAECKQGAWSVSQPQAGAPNKP